MEDIDIDNLLDNWYKTKQEISVLEEKCEKYKKVSTKLMEQIEKNSLNSESNILQKTPF